jgi:hypothetical protein
MHIECLKSRKKGAYFILLDTKGDVCSVINPEGKQMDCPSEFFLKDENNECLIEPVPISNLESSQIDAFKLYSEKNPEPSDDILKTDYNEFCISEVIYNRLITPSTRYKFLKISINEGENHPHGHYMIPKSVVIALVQGWMPKHHWKKNRNHSSSTLLPDLKKYWLPKKKK